MFGAILLWGFWQPNRVSRANWSIDRIGNAWTICAHSAYTLERRLIWGRCFVSSYTKTFYKRYARLHVCEVLLYWFPWDQNTVTAVFSVFDHHVLSNPHDHWNLNNGFDTWVTAGISCIYDCVSLSLTHVQLSDPNQQCYCSENSVAVGLVLRGYRVTLNLMQCPVS